MRLSERAAREEEGRRQPFGSERGQRVAKVAGEIVVKRDGDRQWLAAAPDARCFDDARRRHHAVVAAEMAQLPPESGCGHAGHDLRVRIVGGLAADAVVDEDDAGRGG